MRRITLWLVSTVAVVVLLFSYRTSLGSSASSSSAAGVATDSSGNSGNVFKGSVAQTRWGPVQVQVTIEGGKIVDVSTLQQPDGNPRDIEINNFAVPQLRQEVLQAQSANIATVSGATVTSDGYIESLQAALDAANFGK
jgi:uncharacterized protein with FMN-binding domain